MIKWIRLGFSCGPLVLRANCKMKKFIKHKDKYSIEERTKAVRDYCKSISHGGFRTRFIVEGEENIPADTQAVYVGNHRSVLDPILFYALTDFPCTVVAKKEVEKMPIFGNVIKAIDGFFLDRGNLRAELQTFREINKELKENSNLSLLIYPEGTRSKAPDFNLLDFHAGTFKIATKLGLPICPFVMYHTDRILNQQFHYHRYPVQVAFLKPLTKEEYENMTGDEISSLLHSKIEAEIEKMKAKEEELIMQYNSYSKKKAQRVMRYKNR